jgi:hypothetical protein
VREIIILSLPLGAGGNNNWAEFGMSFFLTVPSTKFVYIIFKNAVHNSHKTHFHKYKDKSVNAIEEIFLYIMRPINAFYFTKDTLLVHFKLKSVSSVLGK